MNGQLRIWRALRKIFHSFLRRGRLPSFQPKQRSGMKIYKVMTQKDRAFGGKFNPEKVEEALNGLAKEGWEVTGVVSAEFPSFGGGRQELVIFLAKDV